MVPINIFYGIQTKCIQLDYIKRRDKISKMSELYFVNSHCHAGVVALFVVVTRYLANCANEGQTIKTHSDKLPPDFTVRFNCLSFISTICMDSIERKLNWPAVIFLTCRTKREIKKCRKISNISHTKSPNLNVSRLALQLSLPNPMKPGVKSRMNM